MNIKAMPVQTVDSYRIRLSSDGSNTLTGLVSTEALVSLQHGYDNLTIKFYNLLLDSTAVRLCFKRSSVRTNSARYQVVSTKFIQEL